MSLSMEVTVNEIPEAMARAEFGAGQLFMANTTRALKEFLEEFTPEGETGKLASSYHSKSDEKAGVVWSDQDYGVAVDEGSGEFGASRQPLRPDTAKALKFYWPKIGAMTIWKGDLAPGAPRARFVAWAIANGMVPFLVWPRGQEGQRFTDKSVLALSKETYYIMRRSLREAGAR